MKFVQLNIPVDERVPEGCKLVLAYASSDNEEIIIPIDDLEKEGDEHNCDYEGCGTLEHVKRFSVHVRLLDEASGTIASSQTRLANGVETKA